MPHTRIHHHHHRHHHSKDDDDDEDEAYSKTDKHTPTATTIMHRWRRRLWLLWNHHHHPQQQPMHRLVVIRASLLLFVLMTIIIIIIAVTVVLVIIAASIFIWIFQHAQCFSREFGTVWMEGPAHEMHRVCPKPLYETLLSHDNHNNNNNNNLHPINNKKPHICITTLTDHHHQSQSQSPLFFLWLWWWQRWVVKCRDFDAVQQMTWPNRVAYSQLHGYTLIDASPLMDTSRPPAWSKIRAVQALLSSLSSTSSSAPSALSMSSASGYTYNEQAMQSTIKWPSRKCDWVFWMDADTVIMNMTIKLESLLPVNDDIHLIATVDRRFGVNSGAWLIRNSDWSRDFLEEWWNLKAWVRPAGLSLSGDNAAFGYLVQKRIKEEQQQQQQNTTSSSSSSSSRHQATIQVPARCNFNSFGVFLRQTTKKRLGHSSSTGKNNNIIPESSSSSSISWMQQQEWYLSDQYYHAGDFVAHASGIDQKAAGIELLLNRAAQLEQQQQQQQ